MAPLYEKILLMGFGGVAAGVAMFAKPLAAWWAAYWQKRARDLATPPAPELTPIEEIVTSELPSAVPETSVAILPPATSPPPSSPLQLISRRQSEDLWDEVEAQVQIIYEEFLPDRVTLIRYQWQQRPEGRQLIATCLYEAKVPRLRSVKRDYRAGVEVTEPLLGLFRLLQVEGSLYLPDVAKVADPQLRALLSYYGTKEAYYHLMLLGTGGEPIGCLSVSYATYHGLTDEQRAGLRQSARVIQHLLVAALHSEAALVPM